MHLGSTDTSTSNASQSGEHDGEVIDVTERIVVSPVGGVFTPVATGSHVAAGEPLGHVEVAGHELVPVTSPFAGRLVEMVAWSGERVQPQQRIAWLRAS